MLFLGTAMTQVSTVCRSVFNLLFATRELHLTEAQFGRIMGIGSLVSLGVILLMGYLMDKLHPLRVFLWSGVLVILINVWGYFHVTDYATFFAVGIVIVIVYSVQTLSSVPMYIALFPPEKRFGPEDFPMVRFTVVSDAGETRGLLCAGRSYLYLNDKCYHLPGGGPYEPLRELISA